MSNEDWKVVLWGTFFLALSAHLSLAWDARAINDLRGRVSALETPRD